MFHPVRDEIYDGSDQSIAGHGLVAVLSVNTEKKSRSYEVSEKSTQTIGPSFDNDVTTTSTQVGVATEAVGSDRIQWQTHEPFRTRSDEVSEKSTQTIGLSPDNDVMTTSTQVGVATGDVGSKKIQRQAHEPSRTRSNEVSERSTQTRGSSPDNDVTTTSTQVGLAIGAVGSERIQRQAHEPSRTVTLACSEMWPRFSMSGVDGFRNKLSFCVVCASAIGLF